MGDLNAKDPSWNSRTTNAYNKSLSRYVYDEPNIIVVGPNTPTLYHKKCYEPDILDIVIVKLMGHVIEVKAVADLTFDHDPLLITLRKCQPNRAFPKVC